MAPRKKMSAPADLSELDELVQRQEAGAVIQLFNMDGVSPLGFGILVAGPDSERAQKSRNQMTREISNVLLTKGMDDLDDQDRFAIETRHLARICIQFVGPALLDKQPLQDTEEDFFKLFRRFKFIRLQVDRGAADRTRFLPTSDSEPSSLSETKSSETESESQASPAEPGTSSGV